MEEIRGALAGWKRTNTAHGIVLSLQVVGSAENLRERQLDRIDLALNERQLRSLARDLVRATEQRGIEVFARRSWWRRWFAGVADPVR